MNFQAMSLQGGQKQQSNLLGDVPLSSVTQDRRGFHKVSLLSKTEAGTSFNCFMLTFRTSSLENLKQRKLGFRSQFLLLFWFLVLEDVSL